PRSAPHVTEPVVRRRARVLVPPVAADEPVVGEAHAWIGRDSVDDSAEREDADRRRSVSLAVVRRDAVASEPSAPRTRGRAPAPAGALPQPQRSRRRPAAGGPDRDELCGAVSRRQARRAAGDENGGGEGDYAHRRMVPVLVASLLLAPPFVGTASPVSVAELG